MYCYYMAIKAPRGPNPIVTMIIAKAIPYQVVVVVDNITVALPINQTMSGIWKRVLHVPQENHFSKLCRSSKSTGGGSKAKYHSCHDVHEMEEKEIQFQYDTDAIKIKRTLIQFNNTSVWILPKLSSNVALDKISNQPKHLQCALTYLKLCNKAGDCDKLLFKLDTGTSSNLLPLKNYLQLLPKRSVEDLYSTVDQKFQLLTAKKSVINQLGTVKLHVTHSNHTHTCMFFVVSNKCHSILGLPDLMQLSLFSFNCGISEYWEGISDLHYCYKDDYTKFCFDSCEKQQGTVLGKDKLINGSYFRNVFSGIGRFLIWPVNIRLSENAIPVQT